MSRRPSGATCQSICVCSEPGRGADLPVERAVRPGADRVAPVVVQAEVVEIAGRRVGELDALEVTRRAVRLEPQRRVATAEQRIEEPRVAGGAPLLGGEPIPLRIGRRRDLVDVDRHADLRAVARARGSPRRRRRARAARCRRPGSPSASRAGPAHGCRRRGRGRRSTAGSLNVIQSLTRSPEARREQRGVVGEPVDDLRVGEAAAVLQRLRQVPVEQVDQRLDAGVEQGVDEALVEVEAGLVDGAGPRGQDARPADAEAVGARPQLGHEPDVLRVAVVVVARDVARAAVGDRTRPSGEGVPDRRASAVLGGGSLDLVGRGGEAPREVRREAPGESVRVGVEGGGSAHDPDRIRIAPQDDRFMRRSRFSRPGDQRGGSGLGPVAVTSRWGTQSSTWWNPSSNGSPSSSTDARSESR